MNRRAFLSLCGGVTASALLPQWTWAAELPRALKITRIIGFDLPSQRGKICVDLTASDGPVKLVTPSRRVGEVVRVERRRCRNNRGLGEVRRPDDRKKAGEDVHAQRLHLNRQSHHEVQIRLLPQFSTGPRQPLILSLAPTPWLTLTFLACCVIPGVPV